MKETLENVIEVEDLKTHFDTEYGNLPAVDGVSLTVNGIEGAAFSVSIIPHTAQNATIGKKRIGERVNIETDLIGKYVERFLHEAELIPGRKGKSSSIDADFLSKHGFT